MKKLLFFLMFFAPLISCYAQEDDKIAFDSGRFFIEGGIGSGIAFYSSESVHTMTGMIDSGGYTRVPLYGNIAAGFGIYKNLKAGFKISDFFDYFKFPDKYLLLNTLHVYPFLEYLFPVEGLAVKAGWGGAVLFPSTDSTSYAGDVEWGSVVAASITYTFYQLGVRLHPRTGLTIAHSELLKSKSTTFILFASLAWE